MDDMPTINEIIGYYDQAYVQSGLDRLTRDSLQYSSNPVKGVYRQSVAPIRSNPVDPDSDNDGVIDFYDSKPLDSNAVELNSNDGKPLLFSVIDTFDRYILVDFFKPTAWYSYPTGEVLNDVMFEAEDHIMISSILFSNQKYWVKVYTGRKYVYTNDFDLENILQKYHYSINGRKLVEEEFKDGADWDGNKTLNDPDSVEKTWKPKGCVAFAATLFEKIWGVKLYEAFDYKNLSGDDGTYGTTTSIYGFNSSKNERIPKLILKKDDVKSFLDNLLPGTCLATEWVGIQHTYMITDIDYRNSKITIYEGNVDSGKIKLKTYSYDEFFNRYQLGPKTVENTYVQTHQITIYTCVNKYQRLDKNGNIVANNYPALYGH